MSEGPVTIGTTNENSACRFRVKIRDVDGQLVQTADLVSAVMNVYDKSSDTILGAPNRDVSSNFVDGEADYNFQYWFKGADVAVYNTTSLAPQEVHVAIIRVVVNDGVGGEVPFEEDLYLYIDKHQK